MLYMLKQIKDKVDSLGGGSGAPVGTVQPFLALALPAGWLPLDGGDQAVADYPDLAALLAHNYDGTVDVAATRGAAASLIPPLTANADASGYTASASSEYSTSYPAWEVFDAYANSGALGSGWQTAESTGTGWLQIVMPVAKALTRYRITCADDSYAKPKDFSLLGSTDGGTTWTALDTHTGVVWTAPPCPSIAFDIDPAHLGQTWNAFRLDVTAGDKANVLAVAQLTLYGGDPVVYAALGADRFRVPNLGYAPPAQPGSVWAIKALP